MLGNREPRRSAAVRDDIVTGLREGFLAAPDAHDRQPGVVLVGGGPGDPDLVTVAARHALASADVVVADRLAPRELLDGLGPDVELIDVAKLPRGRYASQEFINEVIVDRVRQGKRVVRFKGGDNFVFGRGFEEVLACREAGVPVSIVPGLSSAIAVPARAGIPVTHRGVAHDFTVVSGHLPPGHPDSLVSWDGLARMRGTLVLLMAVENAAAIARALLQGGRDAATPVAVVADGTMPAERTVLSSLGSLDVDLARHAVRPPADHRGRRRGRGSPSRPLRRGRACRGAGWLSSSRSTTRSTRGSATTATCVTSSCASTSRSSTGSSWPRARRSSAGRWSAGYAPRSFLMAPRWVDGLADVLEASDAPCFVLS